MIGGGFVAGGKHHEMFVRLVAQALRHSGFEHQEVGLLANGGQERFHLTDPPRRVPKVLDQGARPFRFVGLGRDALTGLCQLPADRRNGPGQDHSRRRLADADGGGLGDPGHGQARAITIPHFHILGPLQRGLAFFKLGPHGRHLPAKPPDFPLVLPEDGQDGGQFARLVTVPEGGKGDAPVAVRQSVGGLGEGAHGRGDTAHDDDADQRQQGQNRADAARHQRPGKGARFLCCPGGGGQAVLGEGGQAVHAREHIGEDVVEPGHAQFLRYFGPGVRRQVRLIGLQEIPDP